MAEDKDRPPSGGGTGPLGRPGGLYDGIKLSRKSADLLVLASIGLLAALFVIVLLLADGFTVTFDAQGGSDVPAVSELEYGDPLPPVDAPSREGYVFTGWYRDPDCSVPWQARTDTVTEDVTLYAGWEAAS